MNIEKMRRMQTKEYINNLLTDTKRYNELLDALEWEEEKELIRRFRALLMQRLQGSRGGMNGRQ